jgi:hypothetical protein
VAEGGDPVILRPPAWELDLRHEHHPGRRIVIIPIVIRGRISTRIGREGLVVHILVGSILLAPHQVRSGQVYTGDIVVLDAGIQFVAALPRGDHAQVAARWGRGGGARGGVRARWRMGGRGSGAYQRVILLRHFTMPNHPSHFTLLIP